MDQFEEKLHQATAAEGTERYLPRADSQHARGDGQRDERTHQSRFEYLHGSLEHIPI